MKLLYYIFIIFIIINSLVAEEYFDIIKSGTPFIINKYKVNNEKLLVNYFRPEMQQSFISPNGFFLIHFDTIGSNAVDLIDLDKNGVPDYIDSVAYYFDFAYDFEVNHLGMLSPIPDSGKGGSDAYDIYVLDVGNGELYETFYGMTVNDLLIMPPKRYDRFTAFTIIDNNYSSGDKTIVDSIKVVQTYQTTGIEALKITAAHEFNHAIQFRYGVNPYDFDLIAEMTSIAVEKSTFPYSTDYIKYVNDLFLNYDKYVISEPNSYNGYRYGIFLLYLIQKYDLNIIRKIWENIAEYQTCYEAINEVLSEYDSDFNTEFCDFINDLFGIAKLKNNEYFVDKDLFVKPVNKKVEKFAFVNYLESKTLNYQINLISFIDTLDLNKNSIDLLFTMQDYQSLIIKEHKEYNYSLVLRKGFEEGFTQLNDWDYYYNLSNSNFYCVNYFLINIKDEIISFPSPYRIGIDRKIYFSLPEKFKDDLAKLIIYDNTFKVLYEAILPVTIRGQYKVVELDKLPSMIKPGVYLFTTGSGTEKYLGKFLIIN